MDKYLDNPGLADRVGKVEGRLLVVENIAQGWSEAMRTMSDLRVAVEGLKAQTKITWAFLFFLIITMLGVAVTVFTGGVP